jgi:hypothetical protein
MNEGSLSLFIEDLEETAERWIPAMEASSMPAPVKKDILGCGNYGCAFGTIDPRIMVKLTSSQNEAEFLNYQKEAKFNGVVSVHFVLYLGRKIGWMIWRDRLDSCCESAVGSLLVEHDLRHETFDAGVLAGRKFKAWDESVYGKAMSKYEALLRTGSNEAIQEICLKIAEIPGLRDIGQGLHDMAEYNDLFLGDLHLGNIGRFENYDQLIIFDGEPTGNDLILNEYPIPEV